LFTTAEWAFVPRNNSWYGTLVLSSQKGRSCLERGSSYK
jgi:hypothetical protein